MLVGLFVGRESVPNCTAERPTRNDRSITSRDARKLLRQRAASLGLDRRERRALIARFDDDVAGRAHTLKDELRSARAGVSQQEAAIERLRHELATAADPDTADELRYQMRIAEQELPYFREYAELCEREFLAFKVDKRATLERFCDRYLAEHVEREQRIPQLAGLTVGLR
jgi:hypothetical protein